MNKYDSGFFRYHKKYSFDSAKVIVPLLLKYYKVNSVIDVGCGNGAWLKAFQENGINNIIGYDYSDLPVGEYLIDKSRIVTGIDFSKNMVKVKDKFDLLICLELVEHLPNKSSTHFIKMLTDCTDVILFSAAIPGQMGECHINEQPPFYWRSIFNHLDFIEIDFIKPLVWKDQRVAWWYRQNITFYVKKSYLHENKTLNGLAEKYPQLPIDQNLALVSERILNRYTQNIIKRLFKYIRQRVVK